MKKNLNIIFLAFVTGAMLLSSCVEKEDLGFDEIVFDSGLSLSIDGYDEGVLSVDIDGSYDENGAFELTGVMTQSYTFALNKATLNEVLLKVEPFALNIPEDKYTISATNLVIPAGERMATVTVGLNLTDEGGEDTAFIADELAAQNYELGVRLVSMEGDNVAFSGEKEAKVLLEKIAYESILTVEGSGNNSATFKRSYAEREILDEDEMTYTFRVMLSRPAHSDVTFNFEIEGLADEFKNTLTFAPEEIVIPAGEKSTGYIQMTLADDFLETTTENESHDIAITVVPVCDDPTLVVNEETTTINFHVEKFKNILKPLDAVAADWVAYATTGWTATKDNGANAGMLYDGDTSSYDYYEICGYSGEPLVVVTDMGVEQEIVGFRFLYFYGLYNYHYYSAETTQLEVSNDGQNWEMLGMVVKKHGNLPISILTPKTARYIRYTGSVPSSGFYPVEFYVYHK